MSISKEQGMRKTWKAKSGVAIATALVITTGVLTAPAKAADPVTITIWTFGDVIQRN